MFPPFCAHDLWKFYFKMDTFELIDFIAFILSCVCRGLILHYYIQYTYPHHRFVYIGTLIVIYHKYVVFLSNAF